MRIGVLVPHDGDSGGVPRLVRIAGDLEANGHDVTLLVLRPVDRPGHGARVRRRPVEWSGLPGLCAALDALICPGDLPLWRLIDAIPASCALFTFHLHLGVHDWSAEAGNIRAPRIRKVTTARWIEREIHALGADCDWIGVAPLDDELHEEPGDRGCRIGTLANAWYGWKNTRAVVEVLHDVRAEVPQAELWSYGQAPIDVPGRFFLRPDTPTRRHVYSSCRVWVSASISEGLGMAAFEAMQCGTPVVSADNRGIREFAGEDTCLLYPPSDLDALKRHVVHALRDWPAGAAMAAAARARVGRYRWSDCMARVEALLARASLAQPVEP